MPLPLNVDTALSQLQGRRYSEPLLKGKRRRASTQFRLSAWVPTGVRSTGLLMTQGPPKSNSSNDRRNYTDTSSTTWN